jgi:hypothetical protein
MLKVKYINMKTELEDIKQHLIEISKKIDELMYEGEIISMMELSESSLSEFFDNEPDVYKMEDLRVRYK